MNDAITPFRLIQVADLHLAAGEEQHHDNWLRVQDWIARERPDLVVANGDLIREDPDNEADHAFAASQIALLRVPYRCLPGNHDIGDNIVSGKMAKRIDETRRARFIRHHGDDRWVFEAAGWVFVGFDSQLFGSAGQAAEAEQWTWLEQTLGGFSQRPVALFLHKPLFLDHPSEPDYEDPTLRQSVLDSQSRGRLLALCHRHRVRLISAGHKHQTRSFSLDGIYHVWGPSTACVNNPPTTLHWGVREVGFVDYRFRPDGFELRIVGADFLFRHENYMSKYAKGGSHGAGHKSS